MATSVYQRIEVHVNMCNLLIENWMRLYNSFHKRLDRENNQKIKIHRNYELV